MPDPSNKVDKDTPYYFHLTEIAVPEAMCDTECCHDGGTRETNFALTRLIFKSVVKMF